MKIPRHCSVKCRSKALNWKRLSMMNALPVLISLLSMFVVPSTAQAPNAGKWEGIVSDRKCGQNIDSDCNKKCFAAGEPPVLVVDGTGNVLSISNPSKLVQYPGEHLSVTGTLSGKVLTVASVTLIDQAKTDDQPKGFDGLEGNYQIADHHIIGIDRFVLDDGKTALLFSDYQSGVVRRLFPASSGAFTMGPGFAVPAPAELTVHFVKNADGSVTGVMLLSSGGVRRVATRLPLKEESVAFRSGDVTLAGTLLVPGTSGPHPAIILLHGSGPLTRNSFGPYPHFFTSLGFAVLIYDKRGTGASTGEFMPKSAYYPDDFTHDAIVAIDFLRGRKDINPAKIGLWGSSEGGMLTTQVAARTDRAAFIIDSSGFMMPLWQQLLYKVKAVLRANGFPLADIAQAEDFQRRRIHVARTGEGLKEFQALDARSRDKKWYSLFAGGTTSLDELRWQWIHVYAFDPLQSLSKVKCPVLGVFGSLDVYTPAPLTVKNMQQALAKGGNRNVTLKIFPNANHELAEAKTGSDKEIPRLKRQAPGLFSTLSSWLLHQIPPAAAHVRALGAGWVRQRSS